MANTDYLKETKHDNTMDFIDFELSGPSLFTNPFGHCLNDRMVVRSSQQQNLGLSDGNLICGDV